MSGEGGAIAEAREALDYLVHMAIGHDYADGYKISTAEDSVLAALGDVADLLAAERQRGREEALREAADDLIRQRDEFEVEDRAEGCESRFCAGWLLGQLHAAEVLQKLAQRKGQR